MNRLIASIARLYKEESRVVFAGMMFAVLWLFLLIVVQAYVSHGEPFNVLILWIGTFWVGLTFLAFLARGGALRELVFAGALSDHYDHEDNPGEKAQRGLIGYILGGIIVTEFYYIIPSFASLSLLILMAGLAYYLARVLARAAAFDWNKVARLEAKIATVALMVVIAHWLYQKSQLVHMVGTRIIPVATDSSVFSAKMHNIADALTPAPAAPVARAPYVPPMRTSPRPRRRTNAPASSEAHPVTVAVVPVVDTPIEVVEEVTQQTQIENLYFEMIGCTTHEEATVCKMYVTNQGGDAQIEIKNGDGYGSTRVVTDAGYTASPSQLPVYQVAHLARVPIKVEFPPLAQSVHSLRAVQVAFRNKELLADGNNGEHLYRGSRMAVTFENVGVRQ